MTDPIKRIGLFFLIAIVASNSDAFWFRGNSTSSLWKSWLPFTYNLTSDGMGSTGSLTLTIKPRSNRHVRDLWDDRQSRSLLSFLSKFNTSNSALFDTSRWQASGLAVTLGSVAALSATVWAIIGKAVKFRKANETGLIDPNMFGRPINMGPFAPPPSPYAPQQIPAPPSYPFGYSMVPAPPSYSYGDSKPPKRNPFKGYTKAFKKGVKGVQDFFNDAVPEMVQSIPDQFKAIRDSIPIPHLKDMRLKGMNKNENRRPIKQNYYPYYPPAMRDNPYSYGAPPPNYGPPPPPNYGPPPPPNYGPPPPPPTYAPPPPPPPPPTYAPPPPPPTYAPPPPPTYAPPPPPPPTPPPPTYAPPPPPPPPTYAPPPPPPTFRPPPPSYRAPPPPPPPPPTSAPNQPPRTPWAPPPPPPPPVPVPQLPPPVRFPAPPPPPPAPSPFFIIPPPLNGSPPVTPTVPPEPVTDGPQGSVMWPFGSASENDVSVLNPPPIRPSPIDPIPFVPSMPWPPNQENTIADPSAPRLPQSFWARNRPFLPNRGSKAEDSLEISSTPIPDSTSSNSTSTTMTSAESTTSSSSIQFTPYVIRVEDPDMKNSTTTVDQE